MEKESYIVNAFYIYWAVKCKYTVVSYIYLIYFIELKCNSNFWNYNFAVLFPNSDNFLFQLIDSLYY